jgi:hypothetical protein
MIAKWTRHAPLALLGGLLALFLLVFSPMPSAWAQPSEPAEVRITVLVPADATISFSGSPTTQ